MATYRSGGVSRRQVVAGLAYAGLAPLLRSGSSAFAQHTNASALGELAHEFAVSGEGKVIAPGTDGYPRKHYYNGRFDCVSTTTYLQPTAIEGVQRILKWANSNKQTLAVRGAGHSFEGRSSHPELVVDMSLMRGIELRDDGTLFVQAGCVLGEVYSVLAAANRIVPAGTCPTVGIVGHSLGGGIGDFLPMFGYAAQALVELTLVTMTGAKLIINDTEVEQIDGAKLPMPLPAAVELMTVLRGGGQGTLGIVTGMRFKTHDLSNYELGLFRYAGMKPLQPARAADLIAAWQAWRMGLPQEMHRMVSSKIDLSRSDGRYEMEIAGLIAVPSDRKELVPLILKSLERFTRMADWSKRTEKQNINIKAALESFLDTAETTNNPSRKHYVASSSVMPKPLTREALGHFTTNLPEGVDVSFYTSGGATKEGPITSLHPSEFIIEWIATNPTIYERMRSVNFETVTRAGFSFDALPSYPDPVKRDYFRNSDQVNTLRRLLDPEHISTSSALYAIATSSGDSCR